MKTFCRLCEVNCGLEATVDENGRLTALHPDRDHPISKGFACHKGLLAREIHHDPDRVNHPQRKTGDGFARASWDEAVEDIATRLRAIVDEHGPESVALYLGQPERLQRARAPSRRRHVRRGDRDAVALQRGTQDCSNKFAVSEALYGSAEIHPIADLDQVDHLLLIGTNPRVSKLSFLQTADPVGSLRGVRDRGAEVVFVNPLALEDLADVGPTIQIRPDTDAYFLAAMLCEIEGPPTSASTTTRPRARDRHRGAARLRPPLSRRARRRDHRRRRREDPRAGASFATAPRAAIHVSTGVNMGRQGALAYYLAQMLSLVTGNLDREGGNIVAGRGLSPMVLPPRSPLRARRPSATTCRPAVRRPARSSADMIRSPRTRRAR